MKSPSPNPSSAEDPAADKSAAHARSGYEPPRLVDHGRLERVTRGTTGKRTDLLVVGSPLVQRDSGGPQGEDGINSAAPPADQTAATPMRAYEAPRLVSHGTLEAWTRGRAGARGDLLLAGSAVLQGQSTEAG